MRVLRALCIEKFSTQTIKWCVYIRQLGFGWKRILRLLTALHTHSRIIEDICYDRVFRMVRGTTPKHTCQFVIVRHVEP